MTTGVSDHAGTPLVFISDLDRNVGLFADRRHARELFALHILQQGAAARRNVRHLIRQAEQKIAGNALAEAEALLIEAHRQYDDDPMIDYQLAVLTMRRGDPDGAVRKLRDAFQNGFRDFALLEAASDLTALRNDPRYSALVTRYR